MQVGDVVVLNSGGPKMTVVAMLDHDKVRCSWLDAFERRDVNLPIAALTAVKTELDQHS